MGNGLLDIMIRSKNAMEAFEASLRIHTNNGANLATSGYKALTHSFKTVFNDVLHEGYASRSSGGAGGMNPVQYGSGVTIANIKLDFSQGDLGEGGPLDMAVAGRGLFMLTAASSAEGKYLYTRNGEFSVNSTGKYIVDSSGRQLLGYTGGGGALAPIQTQGYTDLGWKDGGILVANYQAEKDGTGTAVPIARAALADFVNVEGLIQHDGTSFEESAASGPPSAIGLSSQGTFGEVMAQQLEKSNVFFIGETIDSIEVQRAMSAVLTAIKTASDQISQVINRLSG